MKYFWRYLRVLLSVAALLCSGASFAALTVAETEGLLADHNRVRATVTPTAANMTRLVWDAALAAVAQNWANQCIWAHNPGATSAYASLSPNTGGVGENIFVTTAPRALALAGASSGIAQWAAERTSYDYATNTCAAGQNCGHYTQLVWARTLRVGCALTQCATMSGLPATFNNSQFLVCNYNSAGNFAGQRPYVQGPSGSQCPAGLTNVIDGLCSPAPPAGPPVSSILNVILQMLLADDERR